MNKNDMLLRTKAFALRVLALTEELPRNYRGDVLGRQLVKSATSIGANYREALRASSRRHYITNMEIAEREASETLYFLELVTEAAMVKPQRMTNLLDECRQLLAILSASGKTAKRKTATVSTRDTVSKSA